LVALILLAIPPAINMQLIKCRNCVYQMPGSRPTPIAIYCCRTCLYDGS
jgi:hypothetical protein